MSRTLCKNDLDPLENITKSVSLIKTTKVDLKYRGGITPRPERGKKKRDQFVQSNRGSLIEFNDAQAPVYFFTYITLQLREIATNIMFLSYIPLA